jgi:P-type Cu+ transporter
MQTAIEREPVSHPQPFRAEGPPLNPSTGTTGCFHCGADCGPHPWSSDARSFCCQGCLTVYELLHTNGLEHFYNLETSAGVRVQEPSRQGEYAFLDDPELQRQFLDFSDGRIGRVTFQLPAIHCVACVWLLENLFRLCTGIGQSRVNFSRKEVAITFETAKIRLSALAALLKSIGYAPELSFSDLNKTSKPPVDRRLQAQLGVAGFAFGNIMLLSLPGYLGFDSASASTFQSLFGPVSLLLSLPVLGFSAADYIRGALTSLRQRTVTIDLPLTLGIVALYLQSLVEILAQRGPGYLDSFAGLIFFLLCGKLFQRKTFDRLSFDRDYRSFFPLSVVRKTASGEESISISRVSVGDRLMLRHGELIPADSELISGQALIDYSFVTGESEPLPRDPGEHLYAGGRQTAGAIEVEVRKPVSESYLTSLWNNDLFHKQDRPNLQSLTDRFSRHFVTAVMTTAAASAGFWWLAQGPDRAVAAFSAVLIVACPCALALSAPFALGTAQRILAGRQVYLKNPQIIEALAATDMLVFDKTGTLTAPSDGALPFEGIPLSDHEIALVRSLASQSTHPHALRVATALSGNAGIPESTGFLETAGCGIEGTVNGTAILLGSRTWLQSSGILLPELPTPAEASTVCLAMNGVYRGRFLPDTQLRPGLGRAIAELGKRYPLALLSGDTQNEQDRFRCLFGPAATLQFNQSPHDKLNFIRQLRASGRTVAMIGDGLNDSGALKESDAGIAVLEKIGAFSPASDGILVGSMVPHLGAVLRYCKATMRVVRWSFAISCAYNLIGISFAAQAVLSPLICAVLMPLSSITVVAFACATTRWLGRNLVPESADAATNTRPAAVLADHSPLPA